MRALRRIAIAFAFIVILCLAPVAWVETSCTTPRGVPMVAREPTFAISDPGYLRAEGDSYLSYPEWNIVHAYSDLAGVTRQSSESAFDYVESIAGFWKSLCTATATAATIGRVTAHQKTTNYIIGISFTAEMALKGLYERTIGAITAWSRGPQRTPEDEFALRLLDDYAGFLQQTPWYRYPFGMQLVRFWRETALSGGHFARKIERRIALSIEYGAKAAYAQAISYLAGYAPADLRIRSVVEGLDDSDIAADARIVKLRDLASGVTLIETPRYEEFTSIARGFGVRGRTILEISGNRRILTTILAPEAPQTDLAGTRPIFSLSIQSKPGWRRIGLDTDVVVLTRLITSVEAQGAIFEHAYDY